MMDNLKYFFLYAYLVFNTLTLCSQESTRELVVSGVDAMMEGNYSKSLELLVKAKGQAEAEEDYKNLFVALNNIGLNYAKMLDNDEALEYYLDSYTIAIKKLDASYEMTSLNNIAVLYSQDKNIDKAIEYFKKAYDLAKLPKDTLKKGIYSINLAQAYFDKGEFEIATPYIEEAIKLLKEDPDYLLEALAIKATLLNAQAQTLQAENLINEILPKLKGNRYAETRVVLLLMQAEIENSKGDSQRALSLCNNALKEHPINLETRYKIFNHINRFNTNSKNYYQALVAMDSMNNIKQNIYDLRSGRQYQANRVKFEILNYETELADRQLRIASQRKIIIVIAISSVLIILLLIRTIRLTKIRGEQRKDLLVRQDKILNLELENEKANNLLLEKQLKEKETSFLLEQEKHKNEIESKNRKLSAKALYLIDRNRLVETIINDLEQSDKIKPNQEIFEYIKRLKGLLKSDEEWENFIQYFDEVNHGLLGRLKEKHDNLNANDIRFISYLYMNLSMKEIASLMNITPEASRKRKERISKKINLQENEDLYSYISLI